MRALEDDPVGYSTELWKQLAELDLLGLMLPEEYGGSGMTMLDGVVVYEELGRALAPSPHFVSSVMGAGVLLARRFRRAERDEWLPAHRVRATRSSRPRGSSPTAASGPQASARPRRADGDGFRLDGTKRHVPFAGVGDAARGARPHGRRRRRRRPLPRRPDARRRRRSTQQFTIASDTQYAVDVRRACRSPSADAHRRRRARAGRRGTRRCSTASSSSRRRRSAARAPRSSITTQYAKDREQFDKPLGAFQAIAHYLADASPPSTAARSSCTRPRGRAGARASRSSSSRRWRSCSPCQTYRDVTAMAQQVFGGVGFTLEYDIQLYFRRAKQLQISWWDDRYLEERVAACVLDR